MAEVTLATLERWLQEPEGERLEFKAARNRYDFEELAKYCCALANEGGGAIVLGVTDQRPRRVVGTTAFNEPGRTVTGLHERLKFRVQAAELRPPDGRVLAFVVPSRPAGLVITCRGVPWCREGESLVAITRERLREIYLETEPDVTADPYPGARIDDLEPSAIDVFRRRWRGEGALAPVADEQLLHNAELLVDGVPTLAALILFGTGAALTRHLGQAELVYEYRTIEQAGRAQRRVDFREGFLLYFDRLWHEINQRNDLQHFQDGLFLMDVPTFDERVVREALLNAVCHRDYRDPGSIFVRQYPNRLVVESPGGLPAGITFETILNRNKPRNRRLAEALGRAGLVERAGQGVNLMFERAVLQSKGLPDFTSSDAFQVALTLPGAVQDEALLRFFEQVGQATLASFSTDDFLLLDRVRRGERPTASERPRLRELADLGLLEPLSRGRGRRYVLARRYYANAGRLGEHTRRRGLDTQANQLLIEQHLSACGPAGAPMEDLRQVLPHLSDNQLKSLLQGLRRADRAHASGRARGARWHLGPPIRVIE